MLPQIKRNKIYSYVSSQKKTDFNYIESQQNSQINTHVWDKSKTTSDITQI